MAQRRHHYEQAFEVFLREERIPYVAVNEARKALLPRAGGSPEWRESLKWLYSTGRSGDFRGVRPRTRRRPTGRR